jgi:hypothetical protein
MYTTAQVEEALSDARNSLVLLAAMVVKGERTRNDAYRHAQSEHDALVSLLGEAPQSEHAKIHDLLLRYEMMMVSLVS